MKKKYKTHSVKLYGIPCSLTHIPAEHIAHRFLYRTFTGRLLLKLLTAPAASAAAGRFLDSSASRRLIPWFIKRYHLSMEEYEKPDPVDYPDFNSFFTRQIRKDARPICKDPAALVAPCDGMLRVYPIRKGLVVPVKESSYSMESLLRDSDLASRFEGGYCMVFRLGVNNYHRYVFPDSGSLGPRRKIPGVLHTVMPVALRTVPVFLENSREYTLLHTEHFGDMIQMEVGAMLVGRICNPPCGAYFTRGQEKGYFEYGGSTVILLIGKGKAKVPEKLLKAAELDYEIHVKMGQRVL